MDGSRWSRGQVSLSRAIIIPASDPKYRYNHTEKTTSKQPGAGNILEYFCGSRPLLIFT
jgi:hypothetical protein